MRTVTTPAIVAPLVSTAVERTSRWPVSVLGDTIAVAATAAVADGAALTPKEAQKAAMSLSPRSRALLRVMMSSVSDTSSRKSFGFWEVKKH